MSSPALQPVIPPPFERIRPTPAQVDTRLRQILARDSATVSEEINVDRLMLMFTRSCELRCSYCMVGLTEDAFGEDHNGEPDPRVFAGDTPVAPLGDMSPATLRRTIDWIMTSKRPNLEVQMFGGEPTRRWDNVVGLMRYATDHPERRGRNLNFLFTTNGTTLTAERLAEIADLPVLIQFSLDGDRWGSRFRRGHLLDVSSALDAMESAVQTLLQSGARWFMHVTLPAAAAGEVLDRYTWARQVGVPALQVTYATGMLWKPHQVTAFLDGVQDMLHHHHVDPGSLMLYNWNNQADPVPLCGDIVVDVDGRIYQIGALFHERRFPKLKRSYVLGHLNDGLPFTETRLTLMELWNRTKTELADAPKDLHTFLQNIRIGAGLDLVTRLTKARLGRPN